MSDKLGDGKFEQAKSSGKADDLNGLGGDLLSKPTVTADKTTENKAVAVDKTADKAVDNSKDQTQQAKDGGDKTAPVAKATDLADPATEKAISDNVSANLANSVGHKMASLKGSHEGHHLLHQHHGKHPSVKAQWAELFTNLPADVSKQLEE